MKLSQLRGIPADVALRSPGDGKGGRRGGGGPSFGAGGGGPMDVPSSGAGQVVVQPPTVERPPEATDFNVFGTLTARNAANTPAFFAAAQFQVPAANVAVIRSLSILANNLLVTSSILWRVFFNRVPVAGWDALTINPRAAASVELTWGPEETFIPVPEGALIEFDVTVLDAGTYQVSVGAHGWFYPTTIANRFAGAYGGG